MKTFVLLLLVHGAAAVTHSLKYFQAASSGLPKFPEFVTVGQVDGVLMDHYDSNTRRVEPRQDWMDKVTADDPKFWERETQISLGAQQTYKGNIETAKRRFNQSGGVHMVQSMYGCEWDDQTGDIDGFMQFAFDGEDFIVFDLKTLSWVAPKPHAVPTKYKWENDRAMNTRYHDYFTEECITWLKKYLNYGQSSLLRTDHPKVSFLQRTPTSPVSCFATGFFPDSGMMFWRKEGEELHEAVEVGEVLPNHDGTFQMAADLTLPADAKDHDKYECVFQLAGVEDLVYKLDRSSIKTNERNHHTFFIIGGVIACIILTVIIGIVISKYG